MERDGFPAYTTSPTASGCCARTCSAGCGLVTEADWAGWTVDDLRPYVERVADWFGEDRLLFGSDWPVCTLAAPYDEVVRARMPLVDSDAPRATGSSAGTRHPSTDCRAEPRLSRVDPGRT
jgi:hypothetical protein